MLYIPWYVCVFLLCALYIYRKGLTRGWSNFIISDANLDRAGWKLKDYNDICICWKCWTPPPNLSTTTVCLNTYWIQPFTDSWAGPELWPSPISVRYHPSPLHPPLIITIMSGPGQRLPPLPYIRTTFKGRIPLSRHDAWLKRLRVTPIIQTL